MISANENLGTIIIIGDTYSDNMVSGCSRQLRYKYIVQQKSLVSDIEQKTKNIYFLLTQYYIYIK